MDDRGDRHLSRLRHSRHAVIVSGALPLQFSRHPDTGSVGTPPARRFIPDRFGEPQSVVMPAPPCRIGVGDGVPCADQLDCID